MKLKSISVLRNSKTRTFDLRESIASSYLLYLNVRTGSMHELIKKSVNDEAIVKMPKKHNLPV